MKILLYPFALLYHLVVFIRNLMYDWGLFTSVSFDVPTICVGNLNLGGSGKTPTIEYLIRLLHSKHRIAVLSRGYKRKTKGFLLANPQSTCADIGDEPMQYVKNHSNILVAVDEKRVRGIRQLIAGPIPPDLILLDDAFQHRKLKAGLNILLTDYHGLYTKDYLIPAGRLRDSKNSAKRADIIIVTKTPIVLSPFVEKELMEELKPAAHQTVYFSFIKYGKLIPFGNHHNAAPHHVSSIFLVTGIANPYPLFEYLNSKCNELFHKEFPDHHEFSEKDILTLQKSFLDTIGKNKIIVTTMKDAARLADSPYFSHLKNLPLYIQPMEIGFHASKYKSFDEYILDYVRENKSNQNIHSGKGKA